MDEHRELLRRLLPKHQGTEIKTTGDGFLLEFASALAAVQYAVEIQQALAARNAVQAAERQVLIRIGIHVGDGVNIAARVEPLAEPGGICVSRAVFEQLQGKLAEAMVSAGEVDLKNLARPVEVFRITVAADVRPRLTSLESGTAAGVEEVPRSHERSHEAQKALAVLPFVNMSDDRENEFLADGITEDLISVVENVRHPSGSVHQKTLLYLGDLNDSQHAAWTKAIEVFNADSGQTEIRSLFPSDRTPPPTDAPALSLRLEDYHFDLTSYVRRGPGRRNSQSAIWP